MGVGSSGGAGRRWRRSSCAPAATRSWPGTTAAAPARSTWSPSTARCSSSSRCGPGAGPPPARRSNPSSAASRREQAIAAQRALGERIAAAEKEATAAEEEFNRLMLEVPNLPHPDVPVGPDESANVVVRTEGALPTFDFPPLPHWELGPALGVIDFERGVKVSGTRFYVLRGAGARLQRALITWMLDLHTREHGYTEVYPPAMVKGECLVGTGNLPKFADTLYRDVEEDHWFVPTAEVPVTNLYRDEILERR